MLNKKEMQKMKITKGHISFEQSDMHFVEKFGNDYQKKTYTAEGTIDIHLAPGGGWAAIITK